MPTEGGGPLYHGGARELQERFDSRRIAERLEQVTVHETFTDGDRGFVESASMFFLATADAGGFPDCSYKGGRPGFVRVVDERTLAFPNCPRYIHRMALVEESVYAPAPDHEPPEPEWKRMDVFAPCLPR